ncbi:Glycosyl transferase group 1 [Sulfitobacter noctilucicola]|uniref:Glycosyltransferase involved in cell wall biosynthesis n=1 Tax=Sulfitobacter noctilucicola TaxID=1342301 RepID=A0A7W6Q6C4_9RHOB|nr:glycosyltransferase [Sulfitobacter noctilucicola]KIN69845.1 Glycosyl transferase group 1 [Sulfitobacter noctilucicola]MBB4176214.1 glycosyltransferase involved in cell wall biosynthesis [Sulfitobacter noctilucicola]
MRFLIDLQCAQGGTPTPGRYALGLLDALLPEAEAQGHEVHLLLNSAFDATLPDLQRRFPKLHAQRRIHIFHGLPRSGARQTNGDWRRAASNLMRDFAIAGIAPDAVFCPDVFEGANGPCALGPLVLSDCALVAVLHDLVPALMPEHYFDHDPAFQAFYHKRLSDLSSYRALIATSDQTRHDMLALTDIPAERIHVVAQDADPQFTPSDTLSLIDMETLRRRLELRRPYLLYAGSGAPEQNLTGLIRAYAALPPGLIESHDLVVAGPLTTDRSEDIRRLAQDLVLDPARIRVLDDIPKADLPGLYGLADVFVMPSLHAGFALPALEAIRCGTLALGAHTASLPDVIGPSDALFDPCDIPAMADLIERGLTDASFRDDMLARQQQHATRFSWKKTAQETLRILTENVSIQSPDLQWGAVQKRLDDLEHKAVAALRALALPQNGLRDTDRRDLSRALVKTRLSIENAHRPHRLPDTRLLWRLEGPFDSDYSLASVNRETALALGRQNIDVALFSAEGPGPFDPDPDFLRARPDLDALHTTGQNTPPESADILSRNMFPPRVSDMTAPLNLLHGYAWEETGLPLSYTRDMATHLQGLLVTAPHVKKLFEDAGIGLPVHVVGNGVDHLDVPAAALPDPLPQAGFTFLHVSSCFPRKGVDVLLAAFAKGFGAGDDVQLIIKTFANPHNDIANEVAALRDTHPDLPPVHIVEGAFTPGQMRSLYTAADALVAPSRAEGYCLPVAEAVLAGTPVLTTGWGGQKTFDGNPLVQFTKYSLVPAQSHLGAWDSVWAEPDCADLVAAMRALRDAPAPDAGTRAAAKQQLLEHHTWDKVAQRSVTAAQAIAAQRPAPPPRVGWITSYNTRCGIATYSAHLIEAFPDRVTVFASHTGDRPGPDGPDTRRCWYQGGQDPLTDLAAAIDAEDPHVLVIQFNYGFFNLAHLAALILKAKADGRQVVMMMHATNDRAVAPERYLSGILPALKLCDRLLVHAHHDLNRLRDLGLEENVALFPHGVPYVDTPAPPPMAADRAVVLGTYGFFLPPKGLDQLIEATAILRDQGANVALEMVNAEYPGPPSVEAIADARARITALGLTDHIRLETAFLPDGESFARLSRADALVFPYRQTAESASGAIRQALALDRPVIATPLRIFDDVEPLITRLPGTSAADIAQGLHPIIAALRDPAADPETADRLAATQARVTDWRASHAYGELGPRLWRQICTLHNRIETP